MLERLRGRIKRGRNLRIALLSYGCLLALLGGVYVDRLTPQGVVLMESRQQEYRETLNTLQTGGPPLLRTTAPYEAGMDPSEMSPAGVTDDQGIHLFLPLLGNLIDEPDPQQALKVLLYLLMVPAIILLPLLLYRIFESLAAAFVGPLGIPVPAVLMSRPWFEPFDIYWIWLWVALGLLPLVLVTNRRWNPTARVLLALVMVLASFASSIRSQSGLAVLLPALAIVLWREKKWAWRTTMAALLICCYLTVDPLLMTSARAYRNQVIGDPSYGSEYLTHHPVWHSAYIGLGTRPNPYGIAYDDSVAMRAADEVDPNVKYVTPEYETALRTAYFDVLQKDPGFVLRVYLDKLRAVGRDSVASFWLLLVLGTLVLSRWPGRRGVWLRCAALFLPALALGLVGPVLTTPSREYESSLFAVLGLLQVLCAAYLAKAMTGSGHGPQNYVFKSALSGSSGDLTPTASLPPASRRT